MQFMAHVFVTIFKINRIFFTRESEMHFNVLHFLSVWYNKPDL